MIDGIEVGAELPARAWPAITRTQLARYAGASGDFNPIHHDEPFARAAGYPSVIAHGMLSMGLIAQAVAGWAGGPGRVKRLDVRFKAVTWPGDAPVCRGKVVARRQAPGGGEMDLRVWCETGNGVTVEGAATVAAG